MHNGKKKEEEADGGGDASDALASSALAAPVEDAINISPDLARKQLSFGHYLFIAKIGQIRLYIYKFKYL